MFSPIFCEEPLTIFLCSALRFDLKTGRITTLETTVCFPLMALIFALQWAGARVFIPKNLRRVVFDTMLVCASKHKTFAGGVVVECKDGLVTHLEPGEHVEIDRGYHGSAPQYVKFKLMAARVRSRQETINARFKN